MPFFSPQHPESFSRCRLLFNGYRVPFQELQRAGLKLAAKLHLPPKLKMSRSLRFAFNVFIVSYEANVFVEDKDSFCGVHINLSAGYKLRRQSNKMNYSSFTGPQTLLKQDNQIRSNVMSVTLYYSPV
jgi:hypothetical protein